MALAMPSRPVQATSTANPLAASVRVMLCASDSSSSIVKSFGMVRRCSFRWSCDGSQRGRLVLCAVSGYGEIDQAAYFHRQVVAAGVEDGYLTWATVHFKLV